MDGSRGLLMIVSEENQSQSDEQASRARLGWTWVDIWYEYLILFPEGP